MRQTGLLVILCAPCAAQIIRRAERVRPLTFATLLDSPQAVNASWGRGTRWHHSSAVFPASRIARSVKRDSSRQFLIVEEPRPTGATPQSTLNQKIGYNGFHCWLTSANNRALAFAGVFNPQQFCKPHFVSFDSRPLNGLSEIRLAPVLINPVGFLPVFTYSTT
jgi:hypothetical protein